MEVVVIGAAKNACGLIIKIASTFGFHDMTIKRMLALL
jgi:hypothetical protein